jgi:hypothetical protein
MKDFLKLLTSQGEFKGGEVLRQSLIFRVGGKNKK